jgi:hypothetical protein
MSAGSNRIYLDIWLIMTRISSVVGEDSAPNISSIISRMTGFG